VATLSDRASEVRADAERARRHSLALRLAVRRQVRETARRRAMSAAAAEQVVRTWPRTFQSSWSDLNWDLRTGLGDVLELIER
jgi:hypothetical protein